MNVLYKELNTIVRSKMPNEAKANELRKLFERLLYTQLIDNIAIEYISLHDLINQHMSKENKYKHLVGRCHRLRKNLNPWSHHNNEVLSNKNFNDYVRSLRVIMNDIVGSEKSLEKNPEKPLPKTHTTTKSHTKVVSYESDIDLAESKKFKNDKDVLISKKTKKTKKFKRLPYKVKKNDDVLIAKKPTTMKLFVPGKVKKNRESGFLDYVIAIAIVIFFLLLLGTSCSR